MANLDLVRSIIVPFANPSSPGIFGFSIFPFSCKAVGCFFCFCFGVGGFLPCIGYKGIL